MRKPEFITFTGVDDQTSVVGMRMLSAKYPIEWGVLFSPKRQGIDPRYPTLATIVRLRASRLRAAAHLCGDYSRRIMNWAEVDLPISPSFFDRVQVNHNEPIAGHIESFANTYGMRRGVAQSRFSLGWPDDEGVDWLFDQSGGTGAAPAKWPGHPGGDRLVGYAGGINPDNVLAVIDQIDATGPYWLDMESGVRTDNRFDIALCRRVCEQVYGDRT